MSKWYEVKATISVVLAVEVEDNEGEEEANDAAIQEFGVGNYEINSTILAKDKTDEDSIRRHADDVIEL